MIWLILIAILPHLVWVIESEWEQKFFDYHGLRSNIGLTMIVLSMFVIGFLLQAGEIIPYGILYGIEYLWVRTIFFAPYWSLRKYGHIYYLGGGKINDIERWLGDKLRMTLRFTMLLLYMWYLLCRFAVL